MVKFQDWFIFSISWQIIYFFISIVKFLDWFTFFKVFSSLFSPYFYNIFFFDKPLFLYYFIFNKRVYIEVFSRVDPLYSGKGKCNFYGVFYRGDGICKWEFRGVVHRFGQRDGAEASVPELSFYYTTY